MGLWRRRASAKDDSPQLRHYVRADLAALHALDQICFDPEIAYSRAELESFLNHPSGFSIIACHGEQIVGFAIIRSVRRNAEPGQPLRDEAAVHILTIDVSPQARRQGVGALLMDWIILKAAMLGANAITLEVAVTNEAAQRFYERFGFSITGTIPGYYNGSVDALSLERITHLPKNDGAAPVEK
jgi:ribosomal-protein-alanine N-acetyltransferase